MIHKKVQLFTVPTITFTGLVFVLASMPALASASCDDLKGCEKKFCEIENQLEIANEKDNKSKVYGLTKSLENAKDHCTDQGLKDDLVEKIEESKNDISDYEEDLKEAKEYEGTDKIRKYEDKIENEKRKMKRLEDKLSALG